MADDVVGNSINGEHIFAVIILCFADLLTVSRSDKAGSVNSNNSNNENDENNGDVMCDTFQDPLEREIGLYCHLPHLMYIYLCLFSLFSFLSYLTCLRKSIVVHPYKWYLSMFGLHMDSFESGSVKLSSIHRFYDDRTLA